MSLSPEESNVPLPTALTLTPLAGALLLGVFFAWGLFGVLSLQVYTYFLYFSNDKLAIKLLVAFVFTMQLIQITLFTQTGFEKFASGFGNWSSVVAVQSDWFSVCAIAGIVAFSVQSFYAWRILVISQKLIPTILITLTSIVSLTFCLVVAADVKMEGQLSKVFIPEILIKAEIWEGSSALCDIMIAGCMTYYLKLRSPEGKSFEGTALAINRIIRLTIETGTLTAGFAITTVAVMLVPSHPAYFTSLLATLSGLYSTTLLTVLNVRASAGSVVSMSDGSWKAGQSDMDFNRRQCTNCSTQIRNLSPVGTTGGGVLVSVNRVERIYGDSTHTLDLGSITSNQFSCGKIVAGDGEAVV